ncbi:MAG: UvrD-helicase domain-containing protein [Acidobacteriota bacterium]
MDREEIILKIREIHSNDEDQINFILSEDKKLIVTASAGCGKTKSMISKIAFELVNNPDMNFKKVLALTFSVSAATKIREDTAMILPILLNSKNFELDRKLDVSNYHSFSTRIINQHGYILHNELTKVTNFSIVPETVSTLRDYLLDIEVNVLVSYSKAINEVNIEEADRLEDEYVNILLNRLIPCQVITYNGLLLLAVRILKIESVKRFYAKYYPLIIVDEFQDTNYLAYKLINQLISKDNKIILMGDDIQKIYGFLGAIPGLFKHMQDEYDMTPIIFKNNWRFQDNIKMKNLDFYLREIFRNYNNMDCFELKAEINLGFYKTNGMEAKTIVSHMQGKVANGNQVALLVRGKNNANNVISKLESEGIKYFNGLFSDTDAVYNRFHKIALDNFIIESGSGKSFSMRVIEKVMTVLNQNKSSVTTDDIVFSSLMRLLKALFESTKASTLSREDKYNRIVFTLNNNSLKRIMNEIDEDIVLTTIHGSKGLEWDYVYLPEITESQFPHYYSLCKDCKAGNSGKHSEHSCEFTFPIHLQESFEEELSLFYVGVTRAKKDVFLFANVDKNQNGYPKKRSCLTTLPNLTMNREF